MHARDDTSAMDFKRADDVPRRNVPLRIRRPPVDHVDPLGHLSLRCLAQTRQLRCVPRNDRMQRFHERRIRLKVRFGDGLAGWEGRTFTDDRLLEKPKLIMASGPLGSARLAATSDLGSWSLPLTVRLKPDTMAMGLMLSWDHRRDVSDAQT